MNNIKQKPVWLGMIVAILAISSIGAVTSLQTSPDATTQDVELEYLGAYTENLEGKHPGPILLSRLYGDAQPGIQTAMAKAPGVEVRIPAYITTALEQKLILARNNQADESPRIIATVYAPGSIKIDRESTFESVMDSHGIIAYSYKQNPGFDGVAWAKEYAAQVLGAEQITVDGKPGIAFYGNPEKGQKSQVLFHDGEMQFSVISVAYTADELLKIAESMQ